MPQPQRSCHWLSLVARRRFTSVVTPSSLPLKARVRAGGYPMDRSAYVGD